MENKNKVVVITGASGGIGRESAYRFAEEGYSLVISYNKNKEEGEKVKNICLGKGAYDVLLLHLDLRDQKSIENFVNIIEGKFGKITYLVNNAGVYYYKKFNDHSIEEIEEQLKVNLIGPMILTRLAMKLLKKEENVVILNISSMAAKRTFSYAVPYIASKFGVRGFTQALVHELPKKIKVYCLNPSLTKTKMTEFEGIEPRKVAEVVFSACEEKLGKKSGEDIDVDDYL